MTETLGHAHLAALGERSEREGREAWNFWAIGSQRDTVVCGHVAESRDALGRPHPLLLLGEGTLSGWRNRWNMLPLVLSDTWEGMGRIAAGAFDSLAALQGALAALPSPLETWSRVRVECSRSERGSGTDLGPILIKTGSGIGGASPSEGMDVRIARPEPRGKTSFWGGLFTRRNRAPQAVFFGGGGSSPWLRIFYRPLVRSDFVDFWTPRRKDDGNGTAGPGQTAHQQ